MATSEKERRSRATARALERPSAPRYELRLPELDQPIEQDEEWCEVRIDGQWRRVRFHDYARIYSHPDLYEALFYDALECVSPERVAELLRESLDESGVNVHDLRVLDVGAGNGMVGERLPELGVPHIVGIDIIPEAKAAAQRDRPGVYDDYLVADLTALKPGERARLEAHELNTLTSVAALGFGDIPPRAFANAYNLIADGGWIAFNVKEAFLEGSDDSGFARLMWSMIQGGIIEMHAFRRYCHRLSVRRKKLHYVAMVGRKRGDIPEELIAGSDDGP